MNNCRGCNVREDWLEKQFATPPAQLHAVDSDRPSRVEYYRRGISPQRNWRIDHNQCLLKGPLGHNIKTHAFEWNMLMSDNR